MSPLLVLAELSSPGSPKCYQRSPLLVLAELSSPGSPKCYQRSPLLGLSELSLERVHSTVRAILCWEPRVISEVSCVN